LASETGSLVTAPSSGESANFQFRRRFTRAGTDANITVGMIVVSFPVCETAHRSWHRCRAADCAMACRGRGARAPRLCCGRRAQHGWTTGTSIRAGRWPASPSSCRRPRQRSATCRAPAGLATSCRARGTLACRSWIGATSELGSVVTRVNAAPPSDIGRHKPAKQNHGSPTFVNFRFDFGDLEPVNS
jgi:hypothetical protein